MVLLSPFFLFHRLSREGIVYLTEKEDILFLNDVAADILHMSQYNPREEDINRMLAYLYEGREGAPQCLLELESKGFITQSKGEPVDTDLIIEEILNLREFPFFENPISVNFFVNSVCNLSCTFCFLDGFSPGNEIDVHDWMDITDYMLKNGVFKFSIAGVEPLLSPDRTFALLEHVRNHKRIGGFISNGTTPLSQESVSRIKQHTILATFSLESLDPSLHDSMSSVPGSHARCMHNIGNLLNEKVAFALQAYASRKNAPEIAELVDYCSQKGIAQFSLLNLMGGKWVEGQDFFDFALTPSEYVALVDKIHRKDITIEYEHFDFEVTDYEYAFNLFSHCTCSAGKTSITISPDGKVYPCPASLAEQKYCMGSVRDLESVWKTGVIEKFRPERSQMKSESCRQCPVFDFCRGGCLMTAKHVLGDIHKGDPRCPRVYDEYFGRGSS